MNNDETFNLATAYFYESCADNVRKCMEGGCDAAGMRCELPGEPVEVYEYFCPAHAAEHGYCCACGVFIAGNFSGIPSEDMCESCKDQVGDYDDPEDYFNDNGY